MRIRDEETWCDECDAPEVLPENLGPIELFFQALPEWQDSGRVRGFSRSGVLALMDLRGVAPGDRAGHWEAIADFEVEFRGYLDAEKTTAE